MGILSTLGSNIIYYIPAIILAFTIHEFAHSFVSYKLGDYLVKSDGRLTLNPFKHIDWLGLALLFFLGFGWAKPVNINPHLYKNPVRDTSLVALAGPLSNFLLAVIGILFNILFINSEISIFFYYLWFINIALGIFNLIPVPPLDGSKVIAYFMKAESYKGYLANQFLGYIILIIVITTDFMSLILTPIAELILNFIY